MFADLNLQVETESRVNFEQRKESDLSLSGVTSSTKSQPLVPRGTAVDLLFDLISSARFSCFVESTFTYIPLLIVPIIPLCLFQCVSIDRIFRRLVRQTKVRQCLLNAQGHSLVRQTKVRQCLLNAHGHSLKAVNASWFLPPAVIALYFRFNFSPLLFLFVFFFFSFFSFPLGGRRE